MTFSRSVDLQETLKLLFNIAGLDTLGSEVTVFHAGTSLDSTAQLVTSGGRVLAVVSVSDSLHTSARLSLEAAKKVKFDGAFYRKDVAATALKARYNLLYNIT